MKHTLTHYEIANALLQDENANWTYRGAHALADALEEYEESTGEELELDVVAIRCEWYEDTAEELISNYGNGDDGEGDSLESVIAYIEDNTTLIIVDNDPPTYLYQAF